MERWKQWLAILKTAIKDKLEDNKQLSLLLAKRKSRALASELLKQCHVKGSRLVEILQEVEDGFANLSSDTRQ